MYGFKNVIDVTYGAYTFNAAYGGINDPDCSSTQAPDRNQTVAIIQELLTGDIAAVRRCAGDASTAASTIQIFTDAIETIAEKLIKMLEMAKKVLEPYYSHLQADEMQQHFQTLAKEINQTVNSIEYNFDKPFAESGRTLSITIGNGSKIDIVASDFRFDAKGLNIVTDPQNALSMVKRAITNIDEYKMYLDRQAARLKDITIAFELEIQGAMGVDMQDFQPELAVQMADYAASLMQQDKQSSLNTQANLTPNEILKLLKVN